MRQFFKFLFASCLGVFLAFLIVFGIGSMVIGQLISRANAPEAVKPNTVLRITLDQAIPEKTNNIPRDQWSLETRDILGLHDMVQAIASAKEDDNIKGISLEVSSLSAGQVSATTLRDALVDFRESGKFIVAHAKFYTQGSYFLASSADKIYVHPLGGIDFTGFAATPVFYKDMLDKFGIKMQVFWAGQYKSASEPWRRNDMSEESRLQTREYLEALYDDFIREISKSRGISPSELKRIANELLLRKPEDAVQYKMADAVGYQDEAIEDIKSRIGLKEKDKLNMVSLGSYHKSLKKASDYSIKDKIAVVYAEGIINIGKGYTGQITDDKYVDIISQLRKREDIKAIVLRVNSPGGSALASDNIWREIELAKAGGKVVVASMGDVAASGGYYISCNADSILAETNTITGSIGVVAGIPSFQELANEKIGIHMDTVKTGQFAGGINLLMDISEKEQKILQESVEDMYEIFLERVAKGRKMPIEKVHEIAQGRVWAGDKAMELGLVDGIGGLEDAIALAARMAQLDKYRITEYPKLKEPLQQLIEDLTGKQDVVTEKLLREELGDLYPQYKYLQEIKKMKGIQAIMPIQFHFE